MKTSTKRVRYTYSWPKADNTVDVAVFGLGPDGRLRVLLVLRAEEPYRDCWALPGGFVEMEETLEEAARRELREEAGAEPTYLEQVGAFGDPGRDPRGRVISIAYAALVRPESLEVRAGSDARAARWFPVEELQGTLAFDHKKILAAALDRVRERLRSRPIGVGLLPEEFTLTELQSVYEAVLGRPLDKRNFRRRVGRLGILATARRTRVENHRPARLYRFDARKYRDLERRGIDFDV